MGIEVVRFQRIGFGFASCRNPKCEIRHPEIETSEIHDSAIACTTKEDDAEERQEIPGGQGEGRAVARTCSRTRSSSSAKCVTRSSTRPSISRCCSASIPSTPTRWCAARSSCRTDTGKTKRVARHRGRRQAQGSPGGGRRHRRRRGAGREDPGRLHRLRGGRRDAGHDARWSASSERCSGPKRPDAEPEGRHRHDGHRQGGPRDQGAARSSSAWTRPRSSTRRSARSRSTRRSSSRTPRRSSEAILKAKPAAAKGKYFRTVSVSSTMGPGVGIDTTSIEADVGRARNT